MTPKEKAKELVKKYSCYFHGIQEDLFENVVIHDDAIQCSLILVNEIISLILLSQAEINYWNKVKKEIIKL